MQRSLKTKLFWTQIAALIAVISVDLQEEKTQLYSCDEKN